MVASGSVGTGKYDQAVTFIIIEPKRAKHFMTTIEVRLDSLRTSATDLQQASRAISEAFHDPASVGGVRSAGK